MIAAAPLLGPDTGGTEVTLLLSGQVKKDVRNMFCKFGNLVVEVTSFQRLHGSDSVAIMCVPFPAPTPRTSGLVHSPVVKSRGAPPESNPVAPSPRTKGLILPLFESQQRLLSLSLSLHLTMAEPTNVVANQQLQPPPSLFESQQPLFSLLSVHGEGGATW